MLIISKTDNGVTVHLSEYELRNLTKLDRWTIEPHIGKNLDIHNLDKAVRMAESVAYTRRSILENLDKIKNEIQSLPIDQFSSKEQIK